MSDEIDRIIGPWLTTCKWRVERGSKGGVEADEMHRAVTVLLLSEILSELRQITRAPL